jgi:hypothetical protein
VAKDLPAPRTGTAPRRVVTAHAPLGLATATIVLGSVWTLMHGLRLAASFEAGRQYAAAVQYGMRPYQSNDLYEAAASFTTLLGLASFIVACQWLQASRQFAETVAPGARHSRSATWVWPAWILPGVSLWFPFQIVRDVGAAIGFRSRSVLGWWWGTWIVAQALDGAVFGTAGLSGNPWALTAAEIARTTMTVVALALWAVVVFSIRSRQVALRVRPA